MFIINNKNKGVFNMNNLKKIGLSALAGSLVAFSASAGEMSVSGQANLYMTSGSKTGKTTFSNDDHVTFSGTTELDNGYAVSYSVQFDGDEGDDGEGLDNHSISVNTNGMGTIVYAGHGGSSAMGMMDDKTPNAYEEAWDGLGTTAVVIGGHGANDMITYTSESYGGAVFTVAFVPGEAAGSTSGNESTYVDYGVTITPEAVEGLTVGMAMGTTEITAGTEVDESTMYATYAWNGFTVGYQSSEYDAPTSTDSDDSTAFGISYAVNDDLSISYNEHTADVGSSATDQESDGISVSYTMGGITIAGHKNEMSAVNGVSGTDDEGYEVMLSFAF
jgi:outer membrane protein OmpU